MKPHDTGSRPTSRCGNAEREVDERPPSGSVRRLLALMLLALVASGTACTHARTGTNVGGNGGASGAETGGTAGTGDGGNGADGGADTGSGGSGAAGTCGSGTGGSDGDGDAFVGDVVVTIHPTVATILVVTWNQIVAADTTWLEFSFEDNNVMTSRPKVGALGPHKDVVLGVPGETRVTLRVLSKSACSDHETHDYEGTTGAVPSILPLPELISYDPTLASKDRWLVGSVEDSEGGDAGHNGYYRFNSWTYILDRKGRVVWYFADLSSVLMPTLYVRLARDGEYLWIDNVAKKVAKMTLDGDYFERIPVLVNWQGMDVTDDGGLLHYTTANGLEEYTKDGQQKVTWDCATVMPSLSCDSNSVSWNPQTNTVLISYWQDATVVEIDRATGTLLASYGRAAGSYTFSLGTRTFWHEHFVNMSPEGTLMMAAWLPDSDDPTIPTTQAFFEYTIDRVNHQLVEKWVYEGPEWAQFEGLAMRLPNGNTLVNYGTAGVIREVTPEKQTAFHVKFDVPEGDDRYNKLVGNAFFVDDLYAMNGGPK